MRPQELIAKKRDGKRLSEDEIGIFVSGITSGAWADYQITAMVMAIFIRGMTRREQYALTKAMLHSGTIMDFSDIDAPKADKHSTGGVGDKTSLIIAPVAAACGIAVPMISGRGLGHTGGTLDKLESIPGYNVRLSFSKLKTVMKACGFGLIGQTKEIAPADKKMYALRDATATVPYIPLIVASIMSKKLAEGLDALVLDVKTGSGAFIEKYGETVKLAKALAETGRSFGVETRSLVTDMSQPLGKFVGNALEVYECIKILRDEAEPMMRLTSDLSVELAAEMLLVTKVESDHSGARERLRRVLRSGEALERFRHNIELQGGNPRVCDHPERLLVAKLKKVPVMADRSGYVASIDTRYIGRAVGDLGGGRIKTDDIIDRAVGYSCSAPLGTKVRAGDELGVVYARRESGEAVHSFASAYTISDDPGSPIELIRKAI